MFNVKNRFSQLGFPANSPDFYQIIIFISDKSIIYDNRQRDALYTL